MAKIISTLLTLYLPILALAQFHQNPYNNFNVDAMSKGYAISTTTNEANVVFWNPARMVNSDKKYHLSLNYLSLPNYDKAKKVKQGSVAFFIKLKPNIGAFGISFKQYQYAIHDPRIDWEATLFNIKFPEIAVYYAREIIGGLSVGMKAAYLGYSAEHPENKERHYGFNTCFALNYAQSWSEEEADSKEFRASLVFNQLGLLAGEKLPNDYGLSYTYKTRLNTKHSLLFSQEAHWQNHWTSTLHQNLATNWYIGNGVELFLWEMLYLRGGILIKSNQQSSSIVKLLPTYGVGFHYKWVSLDLSYLPAFSQQKILAGMSASY